VLRLIERPGRDALLRVPPAARALVSWNTAAPAGALSLTAHRTDATTSVPLPYVRWSPGERRSLGGADPATRIEVDIVRSDVPLAAIGVASSVELDAIAVSVPPPHDVRSLGPTRAATLDVPALSQYVAAYPDQRGWCSATALAMLLRFHGVTVDVPTVAQAVYDASYEGTGNWSFNVAYAGALGLRGVVAYLRGIEHAAAFIDAGLPIAISISWTSGQLSGAPLEHSDGHLLVVRGVDDEYVAVNDPAHPSVATRYPRAALDEVFAAAGGVAYLIAPRSRTAELVALANGDAR
jgi:hypothetical protein